MFGPVDAYAWAPGHNVALAQLRNVQNDIGARNRRQTGGVLRPVSVRSQSVDMFPVETRLGSGRIRGDGFVDHEWEIVCGAYGMKYVMDTYFASGASKDVAMTIYTRRHELVTFNRYNCYVVYPKPRETLEYLGAGSFRWRAQLLDLELLA